MISSDSSLDPMDALAEEFLAEIRQGTPLGVEEFAARHPEHAERIHALFPTMLLLEVL